MTRATIATEIGDIEVELYDERAPKAAKNFIDLANKGFYDDVIFHRVIPGFVIQGGDGQFGKKSALERGRVGTGGPGYKFEDEPVKGDYERGSLAMANAGPEHQRQPVLHLHRRPGRPPAEELHALRQGHQGPRRRRPDRVRAPRRPGPPERAGRDDLGDDPPGPGLSRSRAQRARRRPPRGSRRPIGRCHPRGCSSPRPRCAAPACRGTSSRPATASPSAWIRSMTVAGQRRVADLDEHLVEDDLVDDADTGVVGQPARHPRGEVAAALDHARRCPSHRARGSRRRSGTPRARRDISGTQSNGSRSCAGRRWQIGRGRAHRRAMGRARRGRTRCPRRTAR